jgi:tetratricopeptide (TPR) repeat protein
VSRAPRARGLALAASAAALFAFWTGGISRAQDQAAPLPRPAPAQAGSATPEQDAAFATALTNRLEARWLRRRGLVAQGNPSEVAQASQELLDFLREEGIGRIEPLADAAVLEARRERHVNDLAAARETFALATRLDPQHPAAAWGVAKTRWKIDGGFGTLLSGAWIALRTGSGNFWTVYRGLLQAGSWGFLALLATGAGLVVVLLIRHGGELAHEVDERLPRSWLPAWRRVLAWAVVLSPVALIAPGPWALIAWAVALAVVAERPARYALMAWLAVLALAVPAANLVGNLAGVAASPAARVAVASAERSLQPDLLIELTTMIGKQPRQATWKVLAARHLAPHYPDRAIQLLREAAAAAPRDARTRVLLGNVFYRAARYETAGVEYRAAAELDPEDPLAWFNLARVRLATFQFPGAEDAMRQARALSKHTVARLERELPQAEVADPEFGAVEVARQVVTGGAVPGKWTALRLGNPITLGAIAALLLAVALRIRSGGARSIACPRCGHPTCPRCAARIGEDGTCFRCGQLLGRREGLDPDARREQAQRIERHLTRRSRLLTALHAVWPGLSWVYEGRVWSGLALAVTWAFLLLGALFPERLLPMTSAAPLWRPGLPMAIAALLFWLVVQLPGLRPRRTAGR